MVSLLISELSRNALETVETETSSSLAKSLIVILFFNSIDNKAFNKKLSANIKKFSLILSNSYKKVCYIEYF